MSGALLFSRDLWQILQAETRDILLYGMGNGADKLLAVCERKGVSVKGIFASDGFVRGHSFHGMRVMSYSEVKALYPENGCVILLAFGTPKDSDKRTSAADFKRHTLAQISDSADGRLEPARLAPSSINSQPWYFVHEGDRIHVYRTRPSRLKALIGLNRIDVGIALAQLFVENPDSFTFFTVDNPPAIKGATYTGTLRL